MDVPGLRYYPRRRSALYRAAAGLVVAMKQDKCDISTSRCLFSAVFGGFRAAIQ